MINSYYSANFFTELICDFMGNDKLEGPKVLIKKVTTNRFKNAIEVKKIPQNLIRIDSNVEIWMKIEKLIMKHFLKKNNLWTLHFYVGI